MIPYTRISLSFFSFTPKIPQTFLQPQYLGNLRGIISQEGGPKGLGFRDSGVKYFALAKPTISN